MTTRSFTGGHVLRVSARSSLATRMVVLECQWQRSAYKRRLIVTRRPHDLFEVNTFWHFETERAVARQTDETSWQVTLDVRARKVVVDSSGLEVEQPLDQWVEIGIFAPVKRGRGRLSEPLYVQKHRIRSGDQAITVTVPGRPAVAGIDPYHILDWEEREDDNNIERVKIAR